MEIILLAFAVSFVLTLVIGRFVLAELRKLKAGQEIRADGPTWHKSKAGTPTMGGVMFILGVGITIFILGWGYMLEGQFTHLYIYLFALAFGMIGFVDDYRKVRQHQNEGLTAKQKFILQLAAAVLFLSLMRYEGLLSNELYVPFFNVAFTLNWILYLIFAAFVIVGCVNAVNLTDGVDGLATGVTFVVMVFFTVTGVLWSEHGMQALFPRNDEHMKMEMVINLFGPKGRLVMLIIGDVVFAVANLILAYGIFTVSLNLKKYGMTTAMLHIPKWIPYMVLPICFVTMDFKLLQNIGKKIKKIKELDNPGR